jgi:hypothetical protein
MSKDLATQFDEMEKVVEDIIRGMSPTAVAKKHNLTRGKVLEYVEANKRFALENVDIKERARELMVSMDKHYDMITEKLWWISNEAEQNGDLKEMTSAQKALAVVLKDRVALYAQAGLTADDELGEQLAMMEREHEQIKEILKDVSSDCPRCKAKVLKALSALRGAPEVIVVEEPRVFEDVSEIA